MVLYEATRISHPFHTAVYLATLLANSVWRLATKCTFSGHVKRLIPQTLPHSTVTVVEAVARVAQLLLTKCAVVVGNPSGAFSAVWVFWFFFFLFLFSFLLLLLFFIFLRRRRIPTVPFLFRFFRRMVFFFERHQHMPGLFTSPVGFGGARGAEVVVALEALGNSGLHFACNACGLPLLITKPLMLRTLPTPMKAKPTICTEVVPTVFLSSFKFLTYIQPKLIRGPDVTFLEQGIDSKLTVVQS
mmetsp:Transcript_33123/g.41654  ORF Transcript_33123/g.41654 Transcript_33123/m.41654 type:complete len:244 (-) Transcript_33123:110-841(-)